MSKRVSEQEKERMWQLYQQYGTYAKVAKIMHRDPATVSRHVHAYEVAVGTASYILTSAVTKMA